MVGTANSHLVSITTLPAERKIIGLKAVIVLCLIFMDGLGGQPQHCLSAALANENRTIGGGFAALARQLKQKTPEPSKASSRGASSDGQESGNGEGGSLQLVLCEEL